MCWKHQLAHAINNVQHAIEHIKKARTKLENRLRRNIKALIKTHDQNQVNNLIKINETGINECNQLIDVLITQQDQLFEMIHVYGIFRSKNPKRVYELMGKYYELKIARRK